MRFNRNDQKGSYQETVELLSKSNLDRRKLGLLT